MIGGGLTSVNPPDPENEGDTLCFLHCFFTAQLCTWPLTMQEIAAWAFYQVNGANCCSLPGGQVSHYAGKILKEMQCYVSAAAPFLSQLVGDLY